MLTNIHLTLHRYASVFEDIDAYLKLVPNSPASDQVRKTRAQSSAIPRSQPETTGDFLTPHLRRGVSLPISFRPPS